MNLLAASAGEDSPLTWDARAELALMDVKGPDAGLHLATMHDLSRRTEAHFGATHYQSLARWADYARALASAGRRDESARIYQDVLQKAAAPSFTEPSSLARWREEYEELVGNP